MSKKIFFENFYVKSIIGTYAEACESFVKCCHLTKSAKIIFFPRYEMLFSYKNIIIVYITNGPKSFIIFFLFSNFSFGDGRFITGNLMEGSQE